MTLKKAIPCLVFTLILAATGAAFAQSYSSDYPDRRAVLNPYTGKYESPMRNAAALNAAAGQANGPAPKVVEYPTGNRPKLGSNGWEFQGSGPWEGLKVSGDCHDSVIASQNRRCK